MSKASENKVDYERCELIPIPSGQHNLLTVVLKDKDNSEYMYFPRWKDLELIVKLAILIESSGLQNPKHLRSLRELERLANFYQTK